jgi:hypothetical protein
MLPPSVMAGACLDMGARRFPQTAYRVPMVGRRQSADFALHNFEYSRMGQLV